MHTVNRISFQPRNSLAPAHVFGASALASLGGGFAVAALGQVALSGMRSRVAGANGTLALALAAAALIVRLKAPSVESSRNASPLADRNNADEIDYSIIIPVYNRPNDIRRLLTSLEPICATAAGFGEIVIVDDGSTDDTAAVAREAGARFIVPTRVISKENGGVASARNTGFAVARGRVGIVIDSDCLPEPAWLGSMRSSVEADPNVMAFARIRNSIRAKYPLENMPDRRNFVGASFAMNRRAYLAMGGCHERYGASHDDIDMVMTALARGNDVAHAADAWVEHPLRRETIRSMWRVGLNSKYANLFASRHGVYAIPRLKPTAYYFFGIGSHYGSSIAFYTVAANAVVMLFVAALDPSQRRPLCEAGTKAGIVFAGSYVAALTALGLLTRVSFRELPYYVATLATFQFATLVGRLRGTRDYGVPLL